MTTTTATAATADPSGPRSTAITPAAAPGADGPATRRPTSLIEWLEYLAVALLAFVPLLAVRPGVVTSDTKTYLYLDPSRFLSQVAWMWNPTVALGTVTHEYIGYLLPMGPFYALLHAATCPPGWPSGCGWGPSSSPPVPASSTCVGSWASADPVGWSPPWPSCCRPISCSTPGVSRSSSCPGPGCPGWWPSGPALRRGGWRYPALFALVVAVVSGINASSIIYVGVGPALWLIYAVAIEREGPWRRAWGWP